MFYSEPWFSILKRIITYMHWYETKIDVFQDCATMKQNSKKRLLIGVKALNWIKVHNAWICYGYGSVSFHGFQVLHKINWTEEKGRNAVQGMRLECTASIGQVYWHTTTETCQVREIMLIFNMIVTMTLTKDVNDWHLWRYERKQSRRCHNSQVILVKRRVMIMGAIHKKWALFVDNICAGRGWD